MDIRSIFPWLRSKEALDKPEAFDPSQGYKYASLDLAHFSHLRRPCRGAILLEPKEGDINEALLASGLFNEEVDIFRLKSPFDIEVDIHSFGRAERNAGDPPAQYLKRTTSVGFTGDSIEWSRDGVCIQAWNQFNYRDVGQWTIWALRDEYETLAQQVPSSLSVRLSLQNSLIVPHREVPFDDIVLFKERRFPELESLRAHLDGIVLEISKDGRAEFSAAKLEGLDRAVRDYMRVVSAQNWKKSVASLDVEMNWSDAARATIPTAIGDAATTFFHLPLTTAVMAIGVPLVAAMSIKSSRRPKTIAESSPFEYLLHIERELW
jgi:hypothetical protein